jgi:hypothetical protein
MYISAHVCAIYDDLPRKLYCHPVTPMVYEDETVSTPGRLILYTEIAGFEQEEYDE